MNKTSLILLTGLVLFIFLGCVAPRSPEYDKVAAIGKEGALDKVYKIPGQTTVGAKVNAKSTSDRGGYFSIDYWPETPGAIAEFTEEATNTLFCRLTVPEAKTLLVEFVADYSHSLGQSDGVLQGQISRTIHAGRVLRIDQDTKRVISTSGPLDTYTVVGSTAKVNLSSRETKLSNGAHSESVLCN